MTRRERSLHAINHKETDIVPYQIELTAQANARLAAHTGDAHYIEKIGNHFSGVSYGSIEEVEPGTGYWKDHFGVVWNRNGADKDIGVVVDFLLPEPTLEGFKMPEINEQLLRVECEREMASVSDECLVFRIGFSLFERAWTLRGMENLLTDMVAEPCFFHELLDLICDYNLRVLDIALEFPFDILYFGDDWGQQKGLIMGPRYWREFIKPRLARMYGEVKQTGRFVVQHSCGDISEILPDVIEVGLDVYQTFQPEVYDVNAVKKEFGKDLGFWGGISTQRVLPYATPEEVKLVAREMIEIMSVGGGYIAAPTHDVPGDVPPENVVALVEAFNEQNPKGEN